MLYINIDIKRRILKNRNNAQSTDGIQNQVFPSLILVQNRIKNKRVESLISSAIYTRLLKMHSQKKIKLSPLEAMRKWIEALFIGLIKFPTQRYVDLKL